jgi:hypothetical protein
VVCGVQGVPAPYATAGVHALMRWWYVLQAVPVQRHGNFQLPSCCAACSACAAAQRSMPPCCSTTVRACKVCCKSAFAFFWCLVRTFKRAGAVCTHARVCLPPCHREVAVSTGCLGLRPIIPRVHTCVLRAHAGGDSLSQELALSPVGWGYSPAPDIAVGHSHGPESTS